jgi:hypothetical protein
VAVPGRGRLANLATGRRRLHHQRRGRIIRPRVSSPRKRGPITTGIRCGAKAVEQRPSIQTTRRMGSLSSQTKCNTSLRRCRHGAELRPAFAGTTGTVCGYHATLTSPRRSIADRSADRPAPAMLCNSSCR